MYVEVAVEQSKPELRPEPSAIAGPHSLWDQDSFPMSFPVRPPGDSHCSANWNEASDHRAVYATIVPRVR